MLGEEKEEKSEAEEILKMALASNECEQMIAVVDILRKSKLARNDQISQLDETLLRIASNAGANSDNETASSSSSSSTSSSNYSCIYNSLSLYLKEKGRYSKRHEEALLLLLLLVR